MHWLDWLVMLGTLGAIVLYGVYHTRNIKSVQSYLMGDRDLRWWTIGLSVMATQASAITFLSTPGQAFEDGLRFAQFYFGLPVAMVFLCVFVLPIYYRLKVYTAYEYLEGRFDLRTRTFTAILFLIQRGLAAGITIYAPAIILSTILGWRLNLTIMAIGVIVIFYTVLGGTKAVSVTQKQQMIVILSGMFIAAILLVDQLPTGVSFYDAVGVAGKLGKLNVVDFSFDLDNRYTFWSGMLGGFFLFVSYFGTDQSQVQRYLSGRSLSESRLGLLFNGIIKVPMQFLVLFVGIMVFVFFLFVQAPIHFNSANLELVKSNPKTAPAIDELTTTYDQLFIEREAAVNEMIVALKKEDEPRIAASTKRVKALQTQDAEIREEVRTLISEASEGAAKTKDTDYVFITFVINYLPIGLVGLILAVIFSAAMSSTASELNALATTTVIDLYKRSLVSDRDDQHYLKASKWFTLLWGGIALFFAVYADLFDNLIQAVNIIGSLMYGAILGVFMVAFFQKRIGGTAVFTAAVITEIVILTIFALDHYEKIHIAYLWLNPIGCILVMILAEILQGRRVEIRE
ncbi:MAG: sodium:solute symporter [Bacteroidetes bacterium]|nr:MAG: sodium:solute symporter [Bacteroidota bacterium]PTM13476.1 MAG: sodium:solute symporter [Bacteroidota bacterium]